MMWNFKADINLNVLCTSWSEDLVCLSTISRGYGKYNDLWQIVGFIYPLVGLLCFFIPICIVTTPEKKLTGANGERLEV